MKDLEKARDAAASRAAKQSGTLAEQEQALAAARKAVEIGEKELKAREQAIAGLNNQLKGLQRELSAAGQSNEAGDAARKKLEAYGFGSAEVAGAFTGPVEGFEQARDAAASRAAKQSGTLAEQEQALAAARKAVEIGEKELQAREKSDRRVE